MTTASLQASEAECADGRTAPRVSLADIEANVAFKATFVAGAAVAFLDDGPGMVEATPGAIPDTLDVLTICLLVTRNGFTIIGKSAPASAANFDARLGAKLAYEDAVRQLWPLMGYALRERLAADLTAPKQDGADPEGTLARIEAAAATSP